MFKDSKPFSLPEVEEKVLKFWAENDIFNKSVKQREGKKTFRFFEGPPTANGRPGIHHMIARSFKDIIPRYKTMRGYYAPRRAGWDTHGLPVEIEIEKELGIKSKPDIEKFGVAGFNERAKASVWRYKEEWEKLTSRVGMWLDFKNPYVTYDNNYIESLWWVFSQFSKNKLLKKSYKIIPFCPRCQTGLSSHELGQPGAYRKTKDPSVYVKIEIKNPARHARPGVAGGQNSKLKKDGKFSISSNSKTYLLIWTTTPWTLPSNMAVAVNPQLTYTKYKVGDEFLWSYSAPPVNEGVEIEVVEKVSGKKLVGLEYEPLYLINKKIKKQRNEKADKKFYRVYGADFVDTTQGTGIVHIAPAFGEDDFRLMKEQSGLEPEDIIFTIDDNGFVAKGLPGAGKFIKSADKDISADLKKRGLLYQEGVVEHDYPFCWRCDTPLIYFARSSWFVLMSGLRSELIKANQKINWVPEHIKNGRFGEWLNEVKDWAISRERYWGTPLPIWECGKCDDMKVVGSLSDLDDLAFNKNTFFAMRHGESSHNVSETIAAGKETLKNRSELTPKGKKDILENAQKLKKEKIDLIFVSPYHRTKETAKLVAKTIGLKSSDIIVDKRIIEIDCGVFNGRKIQEHKDYFAGNPTAEFYKAPPGGESLGDVKRRMMEFIGDINSKYNGKRILIISHGDPMWVLEGAMRGVKNEELMSVDYIMPAHYRKLDFHNYPYNAKGDIDIHKPYVDGVYLRCVKCKSKMKRVKEVADVWFDSGAMPFAQWHYPFENKELMDTGAQFPADYIAEGIDQTRGWFYTLLAVSTALGRGVPYLNVISLGLLLDKNGTKMSKSKGNVVDPWAMFSKYGADVVRWHFYTINDPGEPKRFDENDLLKVYRRFFAIIYNSYVFLETYGDVRGIDFQHIHSKNVLDQWIMSRLKELSIEVSEKLDNYKIGEAGRSIESFVDDMSRWYIRRSRRRFQKPESKEELKEASAILYWVLLNLSKLIAPFSPFFAEAMYQSLKSLATLQASASIHLANWPEFNKKDIDINLLSAMREIRRLGSAALSLRAEKGVKVRQPLALLKIKNKKSETKNNDELTDILREEVNVKEVVADPSIEGELWLDVNITPELKEEGLIREFVRLVQDLRQSANYRPGEKAMLFVELSENLRSLIEKNQKIVKLEASLKSIEFKRVTKFDAEAVTDFMGAEIWIAIRK